MSERRDRSYTALNRLEADHEVITVFIIQENGISILSNLSREQANLAKAVIAMATSSLNNLM